MSKLTGLFTDYIPETKKSSFLKSLLRYDEKASRYIILILLGLSFSEILFRIWNVLTWNINVYISLVVLIPLVFQSKNYKFFLWFLLFIPGILVGIFTGSIGLALLSKITKLLLFLVLGLALYDREISKYRINWAIKLGISPLFFLVFYFISTVDFTALLYIPDYAYNIYKGFGPNQVSTVLGSGATLIAFVIINDNRISPSRVFDWLLFHILLFISFLVLSRGGFYAAIITIIFLISIGLFRRHQEKSYLRSVIWLLFSLGINYAVANHVTKGNLTNRIRGYEIIQTATGIMIQKDQKGYFNYRIDLINAQLQEFMKHPLIGKGIGNSQPFVQSISDTAFATHTEFSKIVAEHGILGAFAILWGFVYIPYQCFKRNGSLFEQQWQILFLSLSIFTMLHNSTRLVLPILFWGISLIKIKTDE